MCVCVRARTHVCVCVCVCVCVRGECHKRSVKLRQVKLILPNYMFLTIFKQKVLATCTRAVVQHTSTMNE